MSNLKAIRVAYGEALAELGAANDKVVALDADLAHATMTASFADKFPERFYERRSFHHGLHTLLQHLRRFRRRQSL